MGTNPASVEYIISPCLQQSPCFSSGIQILWPWSLGLENLPGSCFAQYTHCFIFQLGMILFTASAEKDYGWEGGAQKTPLLSLSFSSDLIYSLGTVCVCEALSSISSAVEKQLLKLQTNKNLTLTQIKQTTSTLLFSFSS